MKTTCIVTLKRGRDKPVSAGHPWVFSGAVQSISGYRAPGDLCEVRDPQGRFIAVGYANTRSRIAVRVLALERAVIGEAFFRRSLERALVLRERLFGPAVFRGGKTAFRVVNAEGDFLPGLIVDRYGEGLVVQASTAGMQRMKVLAVDVLRDLFHPSFIYEKTDAHMTEAEGLSPGDQGLRDACLHGVPFSPLLIEENGARFMVDIVEGQKTGFFLDQRANRRILRDISGGREVLNCFSYTGAFGVQAVMGGAARVHNMDISEKALEGAVRNAALNGIDPSRFTTEKAHVFELLRRDSSTWDIVVLDPPKFAASRGELPGALRGYKDINLHALKRVRAGGFLLTFSCSGLVTEDLFQKVVFGAATDAGRPVQIIRRLHAGADHPVNIAHREGEYLTGLLLRVG
jgi:23S rRNA (cytosine1962-C5)-methyltransferase